jgi:hypothetical protein
LVNRPKSELKEDLIDLRREKVLELTSKGYSQRQIESMLNISHGTVANDQKFLRQQAKENIQKYIDERLPEEYEKCLVGINLINREAWTIAQNTQDNKEKIQALALAKECCSMKLDLLTNATVVDDAIKFVSNHDNADNSSKGSGHERQEDISNQQEEKQKEEDYGDTTTTSSNKVF